MTEAESFIFSIFCNVSPLTPIYMRQFFLLWHENAYVLKKFAQEICEKSSQEIFEHLRTKPRHQLNTAPTRRNFVAPTAKTTHHQPT